MLMDFKEYLIKKYGSKMNKHLNLSVFNHHGRPSSAFISLTALSMPTRIALETMLCPM